MGYSNEKKGSIMKKKKEWYFIKTHFEWKGAKNGILHWN